MASRDTLTFSFTNPKFSRLAYITVTADMSEKHDRSAPSDYHWKILKCRMLIFSYPALLACPDTRDVKQIHIVFHKESCEFDKICSLLVKFSLLQTEDVRAVTAAMFQMCLHYTMSAKIAPLWNVVGSRYYVNNRDFLVAPGPQNAIDLTLYSNEGETYIYIKGIKITFIRIKDECDSGDWIRVLPSLNRAVFIGKTDVLPPHSVFKSYKDIKRHWKNIHGYRLPDAEQPLCMIQFWRGEPFTYPIICTTTQWPLVVPASKKEEVKIVHKYLDDLKSKMRCVINEPLEFHEFHDSRIPKVNQGINESQAVSLCSPTPKI